jgi:hypothetical protein
LDRQWVVEIHEDEEENLRFHLWKGAGVWMSSPMPRIAFVSMKVKLELVARLRVRGELQLTPRHLIVLAMHNTLNQSGAYLDTSAILSHAAGQY